MKLSALAPLALLVLSAPAFAHEGMIHDGCATGQTFTAGDLTVTGAFTRATLEGAKVAAGYLTVTNAGSTPDHLVAATTEATPDVELHNMSVKDGMMTMAPVDAAGIEVPAGGSVSLAPGGTHIMFMNPHAPFKEGECVAVTLKFEKAGELPVQLNVGGVGASEAPEHQH